MKDPSAGTRICIDMDGTITIGPPATTGHFAPIRTGTTDFLEALRAQGYEIVVFTAHRPIEAVKSYLREKGLSRLINEVTNEKLPSKVMIDDRAIQFKGDWGAMLKEIDEFKPVWEAEKPLYKYSTVMMPLPPEIALKVKQIAADLPPGVVINKGKDSQPHITIKYGLHQDAIGDLPEKLKGFGKISATFRNVSVFDEPDEDVLKIDVDSTDLHRLNAAVCKFCPHVDTYPDYKPHVTIATLKKGTGKKFEGRSNLAGSHVTLSAAIFSGKSGKHSDFLIE